MKSIIDNDASVEFEIKTISQIRMKHPYAKPESNEQVLIEPYVLKIVYVGLVDGIQATLEHWYTFVRVTDTAGMMYYPDIDNTLFVSCDVGFKYNQFILNHVEGDVIKLLCCSIKETTRTGTLSYKLGNVREAAKIDALKAA